MPCAAYSLQCKPLHRTCIPMHQIRASRRLLSRAAASPADGVRPSGGAGGRSAPGSSPASGPEEASPQALPLNPAASRPGGRGGSAWGNAYDQGPSLTPAAPQPDPGLDPAVARPGGRGGDSRAASRPAQEPTALAGRGSASSERPGGRLRRAAPSPSPSRSSPTSSSPSPPSISPTPPSLSSPSSLSEGPGTPSNNGTGGSGRGSGGGGDGSSPSNQGGAGGAQPQGGFDPGSLVPWLLAYAALSGLAYAGQTFWARPPAPTTMEVAVLTAQVVPPAGPAAPALRPCCAGGAKATGAVGVSVERRSGQ
ncbi:hypothetical protein V8C86DRAFT_2879892 [Haematococcus lacustris]